MKSFCFRNKITLTIISLLFVVAQPVSANDISKLLESKSSSERSIILANLLHQSGKSCDKATQTFLQGVDSDDAAYWNVFCSNGQSYNIQVPSNPSVQPGILECSIMKDIGVECFKKLES